MSDPTAPPQNIEAEEALLGAMIAYPNAIGAAIDLVAADDFSRDKHRTIFNAIVAMYGRSDDVDPTLLAGELKRQGKLDAVDGIDYLNYLNGLPILATSAPQYAKDVREASTLRSLRRAAYEIGALVNAPGDAETKIGKAEELIFAVGQRRHSNLVDMYDVVGKIIDDLENPSTVRAARTPTGFGIIDGNTYGGLAPGELAIIAARASIGKTALAANIAMNVARQGGRCLFFSLEMTKEEIGHRLVLADCRVTKDALLAKRLNTEEIARLRTFQGLLGKHRIVVDDNALTALGIASAARREATREPLSLVVIDYIQRIQPDGGTRAETRQEQVADISGKLKDLARTLQCPVLALAQLNRDSDKKPGNDNEPQLSDLRESGALEQDADVVFLLWLTKEEAKKNAARRTVKAKIAKNRNGKVQAGTLIFEPLYTLFTNPPDE